MKKIELLAPAGNLEKLKMALLYGADAVYLGGKSFGLRAFSNNFDLAELKEAISYTHNLGKKVYVTVNVYPHNEELPELEEYLKYLESISPDGVIISDPGVFRLIKKVAPKLNIHISVQANNTNWSSVLFWEELGAERIVLARELPLKDIIAIKEKTNVELETFVHGAMCISYSGRCLLSNYFTSRDANRGQCAQPCRWKYFLMEEGRPNQYYPILEDDRGSYIFNSKDMCLIEHLPELINAGISSFKIEGRMKSIHYVATVVKVYREVIDTYLNDKDNFVFQPKWAEELNKVSHREYSTGFYYNEINEHNNQIYNSSSYDQTHDFIGLVKEYDKETKIALIEQRNNIKLGEEIEIMQPNKENFSQVITDMLDLENNKIDVAPHPRQLFYMKIENPVVPDALLRRKIK